MVRVRTGSCSSATAARWSRCSPFQLGVGGPLGSGHQYWPWIHRDDWVALVCFLLRPPARQGPVNATAPHPVTNEEFSRTLCARAPAAQPFRAPPFALRLALGEMADALLLTGQRVVPARATELGFRFGYETLEPALRAILRGEAIAALRRRTSAFRSSRAY